MVKAVIPSRHQAICDSIYEIIRTFIKNDRSVVRNIIFFDTLNDIFSKRYSKSNIRYLATDGKEGKSADGAAKIIEEIYMDENIQRVMSDDINYWLQRAKCTYILYRKAKDISKLYEGVQWAKKTEYDADARANKGENRYERTRLNAIVEVAMLYGRIANLKKFADISDNSDAVSYYFKALSDGNNLDTARTLLTNSKGTEDFKKLVDNIVENPGVIYADLGKERDYLINIRVNGDMVYSI